MTKTSCGINCSLNQQPFPPASYRDGQSFAVLVHALVELSAEELDAHDGEDEPEDEAHQQNVEDGGDGEHERVHYDLKLPPAPRWATRDGHGALGSRIETRLI